MEAPEFLSPEDGYLQLTIPSPFGDGRKTVDIFARNMEEATEYIIYIDEHEMGDLMFDGEWYPIRDCLLTAKEISILTPIIEQSDIRPSQPAPLSEQEQTLRKWLDEQGVYPGDKLLQAMVINSFYAEENDDIDDDEDLDTELGDEPLEPFDLDDDLDYLDDEDDTGWEEKIKYCLSHQDNFLAYVEANWRD
ncbi:hypothetical protein MTO98_16100 [Mucilaginibacter sp. SMC90]|uniref:hypothetical protein n=1 Tax=Mucilaginibacter sp. SMC90 TaxID=2929803 RepID=UPI001FB2AF96|nr:hypothetical protein [Mucilaginibacter sp. SMC90]UOE52600.1 hypothetical protein MTO98_16100 [Mucilaginibacter sp. SMC90]